MYLSVSMYEVLLFSLYMNLSPILFVLSSRGGSFASTGGCGGSILYKHNLLHSYRFCSLFLFGRVPAGTNLLQST